jgi:hypothetical protein
VKIHDGNHILAVQTSFESVPLLSTDYLDCINDYSKGYRNR